MPCCCLSATFPLPAAWPDLAFLQCPLPPFVFYPVSVPSPTLSSTQILYLSLCAALAKPHLPLPFLHPLLLLAGKLFMALHCPRANSSTKIPWEHGGMAGVSRAGRATAKPPHRQLEKGLVWKERTVGGLPAPGVATAMVHTHLQSPPVQVLGFGLVLRRAVSRVGVNTHRVTPVPIRVTWCQTWAMETGACPLLRISAAVQNQACFGFSPFQFWDKVSWSLQVSRP